MECNELRIGNWINASFDKEVVDVLCDSVNTHFDEGLPYGMIEPIPLTEKWLLKFGVDNNYTIDIKCGKKKISFGWGSKIVHSGKRFGFTSNKYPHIKHVHSLQNLYFALTGEELELKTND